MSEETLQSNSSISYPTKIAIGVVCTIAALGIIFLILYFTVIKKHNDANTGNAKFGSIQIQDSTTNTGPPFYPGDTVNLIYAFTPDGFSGKATWFFSQDNGKNYTNISAGAFSNNTRFTIPANVFTTEARFKVADETNLKDFVTTPLLTIQPYMQWSAGVGFQAKATVRTGDSLTTVLTVDPLLLVYDSPSDWTLQTGFSTTNFTVLNTGIITQVVPNTSNRTLTFQWYTTTASDPVYIRLSTTSLIVDNYPSNLTAFSGFPVTVVVGPNPNPSPPPPTPGTFTMISLTVQDMSSQSPLSYPYNTPVQLELDFSGTFPTPPPTLNWDYSDLSDTISIPNGDLQFSLNGATAIYQWTIPAGFPAHFNVSQIYINVGDGTTIVTSKPFAVSTVFTGMSQLDDTTVNCYPAAAYTRNYNRLPLFFSSVSNREEWTSTPGNPVIWNMSISLALDTAPTELANAITDAYVDPQNSSSIILRWSVSQEQIFGPTLPVAGTVSPLYVFVTATKGTSPTLTTIVRSTGRTVHFTASPWMAPSAVMKVMVSPGDEQLVSVDPSVKNIVYPYTSTITSWTLLEQFILNEYHICIIDPKFINTPQCMTFENFVSAVVTTVPYPIRITQLDTQSTVCFNAVSIYDVETPPNPDSGLFYPVLSIANQTPVYNIVNTNTDSAIQDGKFVTPPPCNTISNLPSGTSAFTPTWAVSIPK